MAKSSNPQNTNKQVVVTSNDLIHAKYTFTLWQKRVFVYMVSQINSMEDKEFQLQHMYIKDIMRFFKVKNKDDYNVIRRIPEQLYEMSIKMPYKSNQGHKRWREIRILSQYTRPEDKEEDNAYIEMKFNDDLKPHLLELQKLFSLYDIENIIQLRSVYSFKIYELLKAHEFAGKWVVPLEELKEILDVEGKYNHYGSFKLKILQQAQKDLDECCDTTFELQEMTNRKKVESLVFNIKKNNNKDKTQKAITAAAESLATTQDTEGGGLQATFVQTEDIFDRLFEKYFVQLRTYGISASTLTVWVSTYPEAHIEACIEAFLEKIKSGKIKADAAGQGGYLRTLIEKADFSVKEAVKKAKIVAQKQAQKIEEQAKNQSLNKSEQAKKQLENDKAVLKQLFSENKDLEREIIQRINLREGSNYTPLDYENFPFLLSKVLLEVRKQYADRF